MAARERLKTVEEKGDKKALQSAVEEVLSDAPRKGTEPTFSAVQVCQIVAVALESPKKSGRPTSHWTHKELAAEAMKRKIVESISSRQVGRFLKRGRHQAASVHLLVEPQD